MMHTLFLVSHTHWDREWYEPFQVFRARLVRCIDRLLNIFETDPAYKHFMLDGQTIVLEDYLEVRPDREQILRNHVRAERIAVGPWYILPDEFLVSGEAIIRNLQRGIRIARDFGKSMPVGYIPDPFGHISQMPQILRGFGLGVAALRRGLADEPVELWWQAPDGTRVLLCYLRDSYDNAAWLPRDDAGFAEGVVHLRDSLAPHTSTSNFLLMHGTDHMEPWDNTSDLIKSARAQNPALEIIHASLPMYIERLQNEIAQRKLDLSVVHGELRNPKRHHLLPGVLSTRMWIKQRNADAQTLLEKWAEPFSIFANQQTSPLIQIAWKYLLQNHPHDSICGCSVDQVHDEMKTRFDWVEQIAEPIVNNALAAIASIIDTQSDPNAIPIVVFNPTGETRTDIVRANLAFAVKAKNIAISDQAGNHLPSHVSAHSKTNLEIEFLARDVPSFGYKIFYISASRSADGINKAAQFLENEFFIVEPNQTDGTLTITDKHAGTVYRDMHRFVDGGDSGDLYNYCPPGNDTLIDQPASPPQIEMEKNPARQSAHITLNYQFPVKLTNDRSSRSPEFVAAKIVTTISIYPGVRRIDFRTEVDNRACDHRLQVEFPAPIVTAYTNASQAFDVVARKIEMPTDTREWIEQPRPEAPMQNFVSINDDKIGITLAARGLPEYSARREQNGTALVLTLLRCIGWLSRDDLSTRQGHAGPAIETPGAQEIGDHAFEYSIMPHQGTWRHAFAEAHAFVSPMRAITTDAHAGTLALSASFIEATPREFVISALKIAEDGNGVIVRGYNIGDKPIDARIAVWKKFARATRVNLNEEEIAPIELTDGRVVNVRVRAKEIVTIKFE